MCMERGQLGAFLRGHAYECWETACRHQWTKNCPRRPRRTLAACVSSLQPSSSNIGWTEEAAIPRCGVHGWGLLTGVRVAICDSARIFSLCSCRVTFNAPLCSARCPPKDWDASLTETGRQHRHTHDSHLQAVSQRAVYYQRHQAKDGAAGHVPQAAHVEAQCRWRGLWPRIRKQGRGWRPRLCCSSGSVSAPCVKQWYCCCLETIHPRRSGVYRLSLRSMIAIARPDSWCTAPEKKIWVWCSLADSLKRQPYSRTMDWAQAWADQETVKTEPEISACEPTSQLRRI